MQESSSISLVIIFLQTTGSLGGLLTHTPHFAGLHSLLSECTEPGAEKLFEGMKRLEWAFRTAQFPLEERDLTLYKEMRRICSTSYSGQSSPNSSVGQARNALERAFGSECLQVVKGRPKVYSIEIIQTESRFHSQGTVLHRRIGKLYLSNCTKILMQLESGEILWNSMLLG